jgi:anti-sigma factor RsiW
MKLSEADLKELYGGGTRRSAGERTACIGADVLTRAVSGELSAIERESVAEHLSICSDCAEEYRLIQPLKSWAEAMAMREEPASVASAATVGAISGRETKAVAAPRPAWWQSLTVLLAPSNIGYAFAGLFLIVSLFLGFWILSLRQQNQRATAQLDQERADRQKLTSSTAPAPGATQSPVETASKQAQASPQNAENQTHVAELRRRVDELSRPQVNAPIIDLEPQGSLRGQTSAAARTIEIPAAANVFTFVLNVIGQPSYQAYALEIHDQRGRIVWSGSGLRKSPYNTFTVTMPRRLFPSGEYRLKLYGLGKARRELIQEYAVRIEYK